MATHFHFSQWNTPARGFSFFSAALLRTTGTQTTAQTVSLGVKRIPRAISTGAHAFKYAYTTQQQQEREHTQLKKCLPKRQYGELCIYDTQRAACIYLFAPPPPPPRVPTRKCVNPSNLSCAQNSRIIYTLDAALIFIQFTGADITQM